MAKYVNTKLVLEKIKLGNWNKIEAVISLGKFKNF
jgi:hypothetical protein